MHMYVCMYVCTYVCACTHMCVCVCVVNFNEKMCINFEK